MPFASPILSALFPPHGSWTWRRRTAVLSALTMMAGILHSTFVDRDLAHATMVMGHCQDGLELVLTIYVGGAVADAHLKRKVAAQTADPPADKPV
jgi:hypothetical protein